MPITIINSRNSFKGLFFFLDFLPGIVFISISEVKSLCQLKILELFKKCTLLQYNTDMLKLGAKELRVTKAPEEHKKLLKKNPIYIIVDNVLDTYNIGAIFRLADAVSAQKVFLCGQTEIPPNHRIKKASINTTEWVSWEYAETASLAIQKLRQEVSGIAIYAIEQDSRSIPYDKPMYSLPIAVIVGHETDGVSKEALDLADSIIELPMWGVNISLNVMVSLGIVLYEITKNLQKTNE